jgi:TatD DNase family protein
VTLFDVHAHLTHPDFHDTVDAVIERAREKGLRSIISNGLNPEDNEAVRRLAARFPEVRPAFGYYPVDAVLAEMRESGHEYPGDHPSTDPTEAVAWVRDHVDEAFCIGEIGLDGYWVPEQFWEAQERVFRELLQLALEADKAVIIHTRKRERRALEVLDELGVRRVNWHCFGSLIPYWRRRFSAVSNIPPGTG